MQVILSSTEIDDQIRALGWNNLPAFVFLLGCNSVNAPASQTYGWRWTFRFTKRGGDFPDYWIGRSLLGADTVLSTPYSSYWAYFVQDYIMYLLNGQSSYSALLNAYDLLRHAKFENNIGLEVIIDWVDDQGYGTITLSGINGSTRNEVLHVFGYKNLYLDPKSSSDNWKQYVKLWINTFIRQNCPGIYNFMVRHGYDSVKTEILANYSNASISIWYSLIGTKVVMYDIRIKTDNTNTLNKLIGPNARDAMRVFRHTLNILREINGKTIRVIQKGNETLYSYYWNNTIRGYAWTTNINVKVNGKNIYYIGIPLIPPGFEDMLPYPANIVGAIPVRTQLLIDYEPGNPASALIIDDISYIANFILQHINDFNGIHWCYNRNEIISIMSKLINTTINKKYLKIEYAYGLRNDRVIPIILADYGNLTSHYSLLITCDDNKYYLVKLPIVSHLKASLGSLDNIVSNETCNTTAEYITNTTNNQVMEDNSTRNRINQNVGRSNSGSMITYITILLVISTITVILYYFGQRVKKR